MDEWTVIFSKRLKQTWFARAGKFAKVNVRKEATSMKTPLRQRFPIAVSSNRVTRTPISHSTRVIPTSAQKTPRREAGTKTPTSAARPVSSRKGIRVSCPHLLLFECHHKIEPPLYLNLHRGFCVHTTNNNDWWGAVWLYSWEEQATSWGSQIWLHPKQSSSGAVIAAASSGAGCQNALKKTKGLKKLVFAHLTQHQRSLRPVNSHLHTHTQQMRESGQTSQDIPRSLMIQRAGRSTPAKVSCVCTRLFLHDKRTT